MPSCFAPCKRRSKVRRIPLSELTEDANQGKARVVRERGVYADFATERFFRAKAKKEPQRRCAIKSAAINTNNSAIPILIGTAPLRWTFSMNCDLSPKAARKVRTIRGKAKRKL